MPHRVEEHVPHVVAHHPGDDGAAHDVAGGELVDEALAAGIDQQGAVAAQSLREQRPRLPRNAKRGRMELEEFEVRHRHAGAQGERDAVSRRLGGIRGHVEQHAHTAGREHDRLGGEPDPPGSAVETVHSHATTPLDDEIGDEQLLEHGDAACP